MGSSPNPQPNPPGTPGNPFPPGPGNPEPGQPAEVPQEPVEGEDVSPCEGCGELTPWDQLTESEDMVSLCPKCAALPDEPQGDESNRQE